MRKKSRRSVRQEASAALQGLKTFFRAKTEKFHNSRLAARAGSTFAAVFSLAKAALRCLAAACNWMARIGRHAKYAALASVLLLSLVTVTRVYAYYSSFTYVVYLDGEEIGYVEDEAVVWEHVAALQAKEQAARGAEVATGQVVAVSYEQRQGVTEDAQAVKALLEQKLHYKQYAYQIMVNDRPVLTVRSIEDYGQVMDALKNTYAAGNDNAVVRAIVLTDKVEARLVLAEPGEIYSVEAATELLQNGADKREIYMVSRGDSLWSIARKNDLTVEELLAINPHLNGSDRLMPGDTLNLLIPDPLVGVAVTEEIVVTERIPYQTEYQNSNSLYKGQSKVVQAGEYGEKEVTYRVTRKNGREEGRVALSEQVVKEPRTKIVARGTKPVPAGTGTGQFLWPVAGRGRVTSRYGYRGRSFHRGIDIGTPTGSAILAADSGTVVQAGWYGSYGICITINHGNGFLTRYAHNSQALVSVGQKVQRGQQIARSGSTGNSTGPHLHFEIIKNGSTVNPLNYL
ncbi:MAG TPA: M23 family metallopeptidase [Firmicutes bacterium]|nr:M23 family metallopeptidase [Bacillota bacterium]